jgi:Raf kinase inhibitor-like YbhB/YbcL family protein
MISWKSDFIASRNNLFLAMVFLSLPSLITISLAGCSSTESTPEEVEMTLKLSSLAFQDGGGIPEKYTCKGQDISVPLAWGELPPGARSLTLIVEDLDTSSRFAHWVLFNIPSSVSELPEAVSNTSGLPGGAVEGRNDFGRTGYGGPCPPSGKSHRYQFNLYALDSTLNLKEGATKKQVIAAMEGHLLAGGQLTGTYQH